MSQKPHLDDFFAAARRSEPVISHEEVGELIDARPTEHTSTTHHITWKGMTMTTFGLGLAAVLSYFAFFTPDNDKINAPVVQAASAVAPSQSPAYVPEIKTLVASKIEASSIPEVAVSVKNVLDLPEVVRVEAPIKVDEVRITEPSEVEMKRLGMKVDGGKEVVVVQKVGKKFFIVTFGAKPFKVSSQIETENPTDIEPSEILPVFVTNIDGTGILTANAPNENTSILTKEIHNETADGGKTVQKTLTSDIVINGEEDIDETHEIEHEEKFNFDYNVDSMISAAFAGKGKMAANAKVLVKTDDGEVNIDLSDKESDDKAMSKVRKQLRIAVNREGEDAHAMNIDGLDSTRHIVKVIKIATDSLKTHMKDLKINMEDLKEHMQDMAKNFKIRINDSSLNIDMNKMIDEMRQSMTAVEVEALQNGKHGLASIPKDFKVRVNSYVVPSFGELRAKVSELVPLRVALNEQKGRGLIFWYEPSAAPAIPKQEAQAVASSTAIESVTINPNPARDHATVRFIMKNASAVTITVHDILGKRLLEAGQVTAGSGGAFSHEMDLSSLTQGVYLVVLTTDTGEQRIERILVNK
jgi:hypothetical protein